MILVIVGPMDEQDGTWSDAGNDIDRAYMVVVDPIEHLSHYESSRGEHGGKMTYDGKRHSRRDIALQPGEDIGIGTVGEAGVTYSGVCSAIWICVAI